MASRKQAQPLMETVAPGRRLDGSVIQHLDFFAELDTAARDDIAGAAHVRRIEKGEALFQQGAAAQAVYLVLNGRFKAVQVTPEGSQVVMRVAGPGDLVGHVAVFADLPYPATPLAVTEALVLAWSAPAFVELLLAHPRLSLAIIRNMSRYIQEAQSRLREASTQRVERRIAHVVLRLARQAGRPVEGGIEIGFSITRQDIALMTGATLHTVSRTLSAWEQQGLVEGGRQHLVIRDAHALVRIAEELGPDKTDS
jgi:CRP-like cAMP-binding protein